MVSKPFAFEGARRAAAAEAGVEELQDQVDTLIVIPNQNLFRIANPDTTFKAAFDLTAELLEGRPAEAIVEFAEQRDAGLVVVSGGRGQQSCSATSRTACPTTPAVTC